MPKMMNEKVKFEIKRKMFHSLLLVAILVFVWLHNTYGKDTALIAADILLVAIIIFESLRTTKIIKWKSADNMLRVSEKKSHLSGMIPMIAGFVLTFALFDIQLAVVALLISVVGDMTSALVGVKYGKKKMYDDKTYLGTFSGLAANIFLGIILINPLIGIPMAIVASITELVSGKFDNLLMPLTTALTGYIILII